MVIKIELNKYYAYVYANLKRCVFSWDLKRSNEVHILKLCGRSFHILGAACIYALASAVSSLYLLRLRRFCPAALRERDGTWGESISQIYVSKATRFHCL